MTMVGQKAPDWSATAWYRGEQKTLSSEDLKGKWYVLYWYPLDFTFVCPTEIRGFQSLIEDFEDDDIAVIGASTDSWFSHDQWFKDRDTFADEITHPIIADTSHTFTKAFGVLKEEAGIAHRATVIVDAEGTIVSMGVNSGEVGRSPSEVLRTVQAYQAGGRCGADWSKGEDFV